MKRYDSLNGLRAIACIGIILMHIKSNINYSFCGDLISSIINNFTNFVFLFMILSSFSMFCGYYDKIKNNKISIEEFYKKRLSKIVPFFSFLLIISLILEHNIIEVFANFTLMFNFLPENLEILGVAWFLGLIFIFYFIFPFFVFLFSNKKRAWSTTIIALLMNISSIYYFNIGRNNMFYSFIFFCIGGLIYLYKDNIIKLCKKYRIISLLITLAFTIIYFLIPSNEYLLTLKSMILFTLWIAIAISSDYKLLDNKITNFISDISLEMYLSHMVIFRGIEKLNFLNLFSKNYLSYIFSSIIIIIGTILFAKLFQIIWLTTYKLKEGK